jgi:hypothetical protein
MIQLGNQRYNSEESKKEFQSYVLENIKSFDSQAWDMFVELNDLILDDMKKDLDYWKEIYNYVIKIDCNDETFGFIAGMRIAFIQTICEDEFKFNQNNE